MEILFGNMKKLFVECSDLSRTKFGSKKSNDILVVSMLDRSKKIIDRRWLLIVDQRQWYIHSPMY